MSFPRQVIHRNYVSWNLDESGDLHKEIWRRDYSICGKLLPAAPSSDVGTPCVGCEGRHNPNHGEAMAQLYNDSDEQANCLGAIEDLAKETNRPFAEVKEVYEVEFARLKVDARVLDYVALFASRRTRARLSQSAG
jgi:hypothetical protein